MNKIYTLINQFILPIGLFFFLTGILYFSSMSAYHTQIYSFLIVPALILLASDWRSYAPLLHSHAIYFLLLLLLLVMLSLFWNDQGINDFKYIKRVVVILLFLSAIVIMGRDKPEKIIFIILTAAAVYSITAYYSIFMEYFLLNKPLNTRLVGVGNLSNPLLSSHIYGIFCAFLMSYFFSVPRCMNKDIGLVVIFFGLLAFVILTGSRSPLVGMSMVLLMLLWMHRNKYIYVFFTVLLVVLIIFFSINPDILIRAGLSHRPEIWSLSIEQILLKPFFGHGVGTGILIESENIPQLLYDPHNIHLGLTYQLGLIGLFIWLVFLFSLFRIYLKNKTSSIAQIGIILLLYGVSAGMTEGYGFFSRPKEVWFLTWLPIALLFVAEFNQLAINEKQENQTTFNNKT